METKRKNLSDEQILEKEDELCAKITEICETNRPRFSGIGYELDLVFESKEEEYGEFSPLSLECGKTYKTNYVSRATVTVKHPKTEDEKAEEQRLAEEYANEAESLGAEELQQAEDDKTLAESEGELRRSVAFTNVMLVRIYKSFWVENVSIGDDLSELKNDLDEFYDHLASEAK